VKQISTRKQAIDKRVIFSESKRVQMEPLKVVLTGHVNAGKSTLVSALIPGPCCPVSPQRCTNAIYSFTVKKQDASLHHQSFEVTQRKIVETNKAEMDAERLTLFQFSLSSSSPLNDNTEIIDLPGWQSGSSKKEKQQNKMLNEYMCRHWNEFAVVVFVVDLPGAAANKFEAELKKLELLKNINRRTNLDIIVVLNKVDDLDDDGIGQLIEATTNDVRDIFKDEKKKPSVIATSAKKALYYQFASNLNYDQFKKIYEQQLIAKMGKSLLGEWPLKRFQANDEERSTSELFNHLKEEQNHVMSEVSNFKTILDTIRSTIQGQNAVFIRQRILEHKLKSVELSGIHSIRLIQKTIKTLEELGALRSEVVRAHCKTNLERAMKRGLDHFEKTGHFFKLSAFVDFVREVHRELGLPKPTCQVIIRATFTEFFELLIQQFELFKSDDVLIKLVPAETPPQKRPRQLSNGDSSKKIKLRTTMLNFLKSSSTDWDSFLVGDWKKIWKAQLEVPHLNIEFPKQYHFVSDLLTNFNSELKLTDDVVRNFEKGEMKSLNGDAFEPLHLSLYLKHNFIDHSAWVVSPNSPGHWGHIAWKCLGFLGEDVTKEMDETIVL